MGAGASTFEETATPDAPDGECPEEDPPKPDAPDGEGLEEDPPKPDATEDEESEGDDDISDTQGADDTKIDGDTYCFLLLFLLLLLSSPIVYHYTQNKQGVTQKDTIFSDAKNLVELKKIWHTWNLNNHPDKVKHKKSEEEMKEHSKHYLKMKSIYDELKLKLPP